MNTPYSHQATRPCYSPKVQHPKEDAPMPGNARVRGNAKPPRSPNPHQNQGQKVGPGRKPPHYTWTSPWVPKYNYPSSSQRPQAHPRGYGAQARAPIGTVSRGNTRDSRSASSGTQPPPPTRRRGKPSNSVGTTTVGKWSPCNCAPPTQSTSPAPRTRAKATTHGPYRSPRSEIARRPKLRVSSTSSTPDGARAGNGPPPQPPVPNSQRPQKPTPASTSSTNPWSPRTPPRPPRCKPCPDHTPRAQTSSGSWNKPYAGETSPNQRQSWTQRGTNTTPTGSEGCSSTTRHQSRYTPTPPSGSTAASERTSAWALDGSSTCYSRTDHSGRKPRIS